MADARHPDAMLAIGEVHTTLLRSSTALSAKASEWLVSAAGGETVLRHERPILHVISPPALIGVDCQLATASSTKARIIGTVAAEVSITGGHVVQGRAVARVTASRHTRRLDWADYLTQPGWIEMIGRPSVNDVVDGFLVATDSESLDLGAVAARAIADVQQATTLDGQVPFRVERTRLRWAFVPAAEPPSPHFRIERDGLRTLIVQGDSGFEAVAEFAADLALHDWMLNALLRLVDRSSIGYDDQWFVLRQLRPVVDHLLHLWMPAARGDELAAALWAHLERRPGLTRQWNALVNRVRDQLALGAVAAMRQRLGEAV